MTPRADADADAAARALADSGVHTLLVQFTDIHGRPRGKLVPLARLASVLDPGAGFSGPSIWGTGLGRSGAASEYFARGDLSTLQPLPWQPGVARIVGDGHVAGVPFDACPRQVLRRALARLAGRGLALDVGIEPEFFLLRRSAAGYVPADDGDRLDKPSYDLRSLERQAGYLIELSQALAACGLEVLQLDHEDAHGQYELNFAHGPALASADRLQLFKLAAQALADARGLVASMMPKPFAGQPGSGMHFHVSLRPARTGSEGERTLGAFVAGLLAHAPALAAIAAPTVNSYKRLRPGGSLTGSSWAPVWIAHGANNRSALVRTLAGRIEWRLPDASANVYLALATLAAAGLDGIERDLDPGPARNDDLFEQPPAALAAAGIATLPTSLDAALDALAADAVVAGALGATLCREYLALKRAEADAYSRHVSGWELERYAEAF